jgi:hypothetical protein|tara:strand:+ start:505 stop:669 length:165 start_codon:yes stop_codon:yes gene_type:complete
MAKSNKETGVVLPDCAAPETPLTAEGVVIRPQGGGREIDKPNHLLIIMLKRVYK